MAQCGTRTAYRNGCRCAKCRAAEATAARNARARNPNIRVRNGRTPKAAKPASNVVPMRGASPSQPPAVTVGPIEQATRLQCEPYTDSGRDGEIAGLYALARRMDDPDQWAQLPANFKILQAALKSLGEGPKRKKSKGRLVSIAAKSNVHRRAQ